LDDPATTGAADETTSSATIVKMLIKRADVRISPS
jgi:hypothetical protein